MLKHTATHNNTPQHSAAHRNTLQHTATRCNTLKHTLDTSHHPASRCNTLLHAATRCNTLQHTGRYRRICGSSPNPSQLFCNALQHTATRCNTLKDTGEYVGQVLLPLSSFVFANATFKVHIQTSICRYTRFFRGYTWGVPTFCEY